jgi:hypothetical protein
VEWLPGQTHGTFWKAEFDGSVSGGGGQGIEFVSPVLHGVEGLQNIVKTIEVLVSKGARVNMTCGFHVHVGWGASKRTKDLQKLVHLTAQFQDALYAASGTHRRETNHYCKPIKESFKALNYQAARASRRAPGLRYDNPYRNLGGAASDRYHVLNLSNLMTGEKPTVEFRVFSGTVNPVKAVSYVRLCVALVEAAERYSMTPQWDAKIRNGRDAVRAFGVSMGWTPGKIRTNTLAAGKPIVGALEHADLPTLERSLTELNRLASKYDGVRADNPADAVHEEDVPPATNVLAAALEAARRAQMALPRADVAANRDA